jgi:hypothetical protein
MAKRVQKRRLHSLRQMVTAMNTSSTITTTSSTSTNRQPCQQSAARQDQHCVHTMTYIEYQNLSSKYIYIMAGVFVAS